MYALLAVLLMTLAADRSPAVPPTTMRTIDLSEFAFAGLPPTDRVIAAGVEQWSVTNRGRQLHQVHMVRIADSTALARVHAWLDDGTPLGREPGIVSTPVEILLTGETRTRTVILEPGLYVVYCLVPTGHRAGGGDIEQHFMRGMRATLVVQRSGATRAEGGRTPSRQSSVE
jgi:hypothetical protein